MKNVFAFVFIALFLLSSIQQVVPSFKVILNTTHQLISHNISFIVSPNQHNSKHDTRDDMSDDKEDAENDTEKDFGKSLIDYHKMILNNTTDVVFQNCESKPMFHLYQSGKVRNHVNEVFRPPLI